MQNALRWYYRAIRGAEFPKLSECHPKRQDAQNAATARNPGASKQTAPIRQSHAFQATKSRQHAPIGVLWEEYCIAKNRITNALGRSSNVVGELAECIVADFHDTEPFGVSHPSADCGNIVFGGEIPRDAARKHAREVPHVNGWQIITTKDFLFDPSFVDLAESYQTILDNLLTSPPHLIRAVAPSRFTARNPNGSFHCLLRH